MLSSENRNFLVVNAFADRSFGGNPAGIFPHAEGLADEEMQLIARQLNLVETVFVFRGTEPNVDRHLRYFTPLKELPIAGHPTVAAWIALVHEGDVLLSERTTYVQKTQPGVQTIDISSENGRVVISMQQQEPQFLDTASDRALAAQVFGLQEDDLISDLPVQAVDTGLGHIIVPLKNLDALMRVQRNIEPLRQLCTSLKVREAQLFCLEARDPSLDLHTRNLCPRDGIEDPACGVGNGALGAYLAKYAYPDRRELRFRAEQGHVGNMNSVIDVKVISFDGTYKVSIGGSGVIMLKGAFEVAL
jgi:trans-2,3-dihydro-3-hydroxyanthranilate isomerase